jgi:two-component system, response regulator
MLNESAAEILLVEDNADDEELTLLALRRNGLINTIRVVRDGVEALDYLLGDATAGGIGGAQQPRVVLLDLKLPKVDGFEVLRQVKRDPRTKAIPVVVLTSSREEPDLAQSYALGANSYIVKPVSFDQFLTTVQQLGTYWLVVNEPPP